MAQAQVARLKEMVEKDKQELESVRCKEQLSQESSKRLQRQLREVREELNNSEQRDADTMQQIREFEQRIELLESENATLVKDLSLAVRRIEDLQAAMQGEMDSSDSEQDGSDDRWVFLNNCWTFYLVLRQSIYPVFKKSIQSIFLF